MSISLRVADAALRKWRQAEKIDFSCDAVKFAFTERDIITFGFEMSIEIGKNKIKV